MHLSLSGKHAMVCGATQGIGNAIARIFASAGASVTLVARNAEQLAINKSKLPATEGQTHQIIVADFMKPDELKKEVDAFQASAIQPVHILINNTGGPASGDILRSKPDEFLKAFEQHLVCNHLLTQAVLGDMKSARYGRIINIISTSVKQPIKNLGVSNTIRAAVASWAKTLAGEVAEFGITVNNILPGATQTGRLDAIIKAKAERLGKPIFDIEADELAAIPARRFALPEEIGYAALFLASPLAAYINGINLPVDGGRTLSL
jgi:3-oxoacyl-[acyl-carrier protein] reductase